MGGTARACHRRIDYAPRSPGEGRPGRINSGQRSAMPSVVFGWVRGPATLVAREALNGPKCALP
jgi:hypothetical protein